MTLINLFTINLIVMKATTADTRITKIYLSPILSEEENENPWIVIDNLFDYARLPQIRELLWASFKTTVTGDYNNALERRERQDVVWLYEYMEKLVEALHIMHCERKQESK